MRKLTQDQQQVYDYIRKLPANSYALHSKFAGRHWAAVISRMTGKYIIKVVFSYAENRFNTDCINEAEKSVFDAYIKTLDEKKLKRISSIYVARIE